MLVEKSSRPNKFSAKVVSSKFIPQSFDSSAKFFLQSWFFFSKVFFFSAKSAPLDGFGSNFASEAFIWLWFLLRWIQNFAGSSLWNFCLPFFWIFRLFLIFLLEFYSEPLWTFTSWPAEDNFLIFGLFFQPAWFLLASFTSIHQCFCKICFVFGFFGLFFLNFFSHLLRLSRVSLKFPSFPICFEFFEFFSSNFSNFRVFLKNFRVFFSSFQVFFSEFSIFRIFRMFLKFLRIFSSFFEFFFESQV